MNTQKCISLDGRSIGPGCGVYVVAELSANHNRDYDQAVRLLHAAKQAGADAVKLQTYTPDTITIRCDRPEFRITGGTIWDGRTLYDLYGEACMPWEWQPKLKAVAHGIGIQLFSTPLDHTAVDFLEGMNVPAYKVASFELVDLPLIAAIAKTGKPMIMSTGMATFAEIDEALQTAREAGNNQIALLKCLSAYPAPADEMNLATIPHLAEAFAVPVGLSDHTLAATVPIGAASIAAVALGACIIEKHLTLSRDEPSPDSPFSLEPHEFRAMVDAIRIAEQAVGQVHYGPSTHELSSLALRRSLYVVKDVKAGEPFTEENIRSIRPANGLPPKHIGEVLGRRATQDIKAGTPLDWKLMQ
jgi:pseudaminic acid synthase